MSNCNGIVTDPGTPLFFPLPLCILPYMKNTTENTKVTQTTNVDPNHGPTAEAGLTIREYWKMRDEEYFERQAYLDYINDR